MLSIGKAAAILMFIVVLILLPGVVLLTTLMSVWSASPGGAPPAGAIYGGDNPVTIAAKEMAAHLSSSCLTTDPNPDCVGDASYDSSFPQAILTWGLSHCPGCLTWMNNHFQCVSFVLGAYGLFHPLAFSGNGGDFAGLYAMARAASLGYRELLPSHGELPISPGDVMAWDGGAHGHVSIVLGWLPPSNGHNGLITFAQANGEKPVQTLPILPDGQIATHDGYWNGFVVEAYIHPSWLPVVPASLSAGLIESGTLPNSPYVSIAREDAIAVGIDSNTYLRQINQESGFNPNAVSSAGAIGIAQFMPSTAARLGVDPYNPDASLYMAALLMAHKLAQYHGDYAKALAAYNAGSEAVQAAVSRCGANWRACVPAETQHYVANILGE